MTPPTFRSGLTPPTFRSGAPEKYERICQHLGKSYDPENAITVHFTLVKNGAQYARNGAFPSLGRDVLYRTGNHIVTSQEVQELAANFEMVLAPSNHLLGFYFQAGLGRRCGAVIPHGIDPAIFSREVKPFRYPTWKRFKFLLTSMPLVFQKGFDLTVKAFSRAFSNRDDVALILRVPRIEAPGARMSTFDRLERLVNEELARPGAPEILLLELDVEPDRRGSVFTGADCYVHPLRAEGFGITILEAMACGLPVIATPWSGPADFLSPRWAYTLRHSDPVPERRKDGSLRAWYVEPELDHLIYLMRYTFEHQDEAKVLGQRAARVAREKWTWKHAATKLASLFSLPVPGAGGAAQA